MSSRFVSGGTIDNPVERDDEWLKAQQEIEANRRRKEEESQQQGGRTLYEVLQSNKAAQQEAFEESIKLKNQFRNLDEDEIEFLDSVLESTRAKEEAVKRETAEQLDLFRRQQEEADKALLEEGFCKEEEAKAGSPTAGESQWAVNARKRKRAKEKEGSKLVKIRRSSTSEGLKRLGSASQELEKATAGPAAIDIKETEVTLSPKAKPEAKATDATHTSPPTHSSAATSPRTKPGALGLAGYSSDEDD
ncbi:hypothetical protein N7G274_003954 [Stereocaulon virgatum]|uniref:FAM192A/Fyv6 N-terminal domain-containing protein n=1 Tax=Stereocaulon virgatum TaxID=373712 RepID=A0ABR4ACU8_9LECA